MSPLLVFVVALTVSVAPQDMRQDDSTEEFKSAFKVAVYIAKERSARERARAILLGAEFPRGSLESWAGFDSFEPESQALEPLVTKAGLSFLESQVNPGHDVAFRIALLTIAKRRNGAEAEASVRQLLLNSDASQTPYILASVSYMFRRDEALTLLTRVLNDVDFCKDRHLKLAAFDLLSILGDNASNELLVQIHNKETVEVDAKLMERMLAAMRDRLAIDDGRAAFFSQRDALYYWQSNYDPIMQPRNGSISMLAAKRLRLRFDDGGMAKISVEFLKEKLPEPLAIAILAVQEGESARKLIAPLAQGDDGPARVAQEALEYLDKKRGD